MSAKKTSQLYAFLLVLCLTQLRKPLWLVAEFILPVFFSAVIIIVGSQIRQVARNDTSYDSIPVYGNALDLLTPVDGVSLLPMPYLRYTDTLYYAPVTSFTEQIMEKVRLRYQWNNTPVAPLLKYFNLSDKATAYGKLNVGQACQTGIISALNQLCEVIKWYEFKVKGFPSEDDLVRDTMDLTTTNRFIGELRKQWPSK